MSLGTIRDAMYAVGELMQSFWILISLSYFAKPNASCMEPTRSNKQIQGQGNSKSFHKVARTVIEMSLCCPYNHQAINE